MDTVNLASRLCDIAEPGQLLAATDDLELPEWVAATEHDPVMVKGMADEVSPVLSQRVQFHQLVISS